MFAGGCAITHKILEESRFKNYFANDIDNSGIQLFMGGIWEKYSFETCKDWIARKEFNLLKGENPYVKYCWSFGNNGRDYLYGTDIECYKKAWHYAVFFNDYSLSQELGFDLSATKGIDDLYTKYLATKKIIKDKQNENIARLASLERLQMLESLNRLQSLQSLQLSNCSYENVKIYKDSVIYCDIPYINTNSYGKKNVNTFDYKKFYDWCSKQKELVIISEYSMPTEDFICIAETEKRSLMCADSEKCTNRVEKMFIPKHQKQLYYSLMNKGTLFEAV